MKHHPKSNNGVFSRKQRKSSRFMCSNKFHSRGSTGGDIDLTTSKAGVLASFMALMMATKMKLRGGRR